MATRIATVNVIEEQFKGICEQYGVKDENNQIYNATSHQFRHNGIIDCLEVEFTIEQIDDMTRHHGDTMMWNVYSNFDLKPKTVIEKQ